MNFKQFLKPDWRKIVLSIFIATSFILPALFVTSGTNAYILAILKIILMFLSLPLFLASLIIKDADLGVFIFLILISIIYWYLLSCIIAWIYDKVKKKK